MIMDKKEYDKVRYIAKKEAKKEYQKNYYKEHYKEFKEKRVKYNREYRIKHREWFLKQQKKDSLKYNFGISIEQYNEMFEKQTGHCAICGKHQSEFKKALSVDHNHATNKIRGLLCSGCNSILGFSKDNIDILMSAIDYLEAKNE